jgi:hypothetical protein
MRLAMNIESHFLRCEPQVFATYQKLIAAARAIGPVSEESKKTSIHLVGGTAFAGVATRRSSMILTLKSAKSIRSARVQKNEQTSANRWHVDVRLVRPSDVNAELKKWLQAAYELTAARA